MRQLILFFLLLTNTLLCYSQTIVSPNFALKSHETLEIGKIETTPEKTIISMSVENRITGGNFCADKKIFIVYPEGTQSKLTSASGIPVCPAAYKFKTIGEKLYFVLTFPPLKPGTAWIDIIEDCSDNCFSFFGVCLDNYLNKRIDAAFDKAEKGEVNKSIEEFKKILETITGKRNGIEGAIYCDIVTLLIKAGDKAEAKLWYDKMLASKAPRLDLYIKNLNSGGIKL
jgi:hypothetical protein